MQELGELLGLPLARAAALLETEGAPCFVQEYHSRRDLGSDLRVVRATRGASGVELVVCCFKTDMGGARV